MPQTRMRMRPWLELQINSNKIPGLHWLDKKEKKFQIPWKHAAKHGWELEKDACLFKNWAVHTGRYKDGDVDPDPKTWKANFRCAMNSLPDIQEVKDQSISRGPGAVRVYRMLKPTVKLEKKEKKSRSPKSKSPRKSTDDIKEEETVEATNSIQLPDDHSGYALPSCATEDMEVGSTFGLQCELNSDAWRNYPLDIQAPDSTDNMYRLQVSPCYSSSEDEDIPLYDMFSSSEWHQSSVGGRGFLLNEGKVFNLSEAAMQNLSLDFTLQEQDTGFDIPKLGINISPLEVIPHDSKSSAEYTLLDIRHFVPPISCGI
ncbi:interferon regulatory factor 1 [Protobothrops mucrosquamatus]|uniref:interferon regulatory factor 1 n=1 Tax=Protobothrops mucrosquamatus TaxID=103944 RepID=UPI0010FB06F1|nr:interferon regulatory factor 1 [Protobothrops mucrosquamatus]